MKKHVSLAVNLRDGYKRQAISSFADMRFELDDLKVRPIFKDEGWCILIDVPAGEHVFKITPRTFAALEIPFTVDDPDTFYLEQFHTLAPTVKYSFGSTVQKAYINVKQGKTPLKNKAIYISRTNELPLKLAQDNAEAGAASLRIYTGKKARLLALPAQFMIKDKEKSEICSLVATEKEEVFALSPPLKYSHSRGASFLRVQEYMTDENADIFLAIESGGDIIAYLESGNGFIEAKKKSVENKKEKFSIVFGAEE